VRQVTRAQLEPEDLVALTVGRGDGGVPLAGTDWIPDCARVNSPAAQ